MTTPAADDLAALRAGDIVHIRATVVDVFPSDMTVDVMGANQRFRIHPHKRLISGIEPGAQPQPSSGLIADLCSPRGRPR